jgi:hypothetical protein
MQGRRQFLKVLAGAVAAGPLIARQAVTTRARAPRAAPVRYVPATSSTSTTIIGLGDFADTHWAPPAWSNPRVSELC